MIVLPPAVWAKWLPDLLRPLSLGQQVLVADQIRQLASAGKLQVLGDRDSRGIYREAVITAPGMPSDDMVTVLVAGKVPRRTEANQPNQENQLNQKTQNTRHTAAKPAGSMAQRLHDRWRQDGFSLGYWADDASAPGIDAKRLGFCELTDLRYLAKTLEPGKCQSVPGKCQSVPREWWLEPVAWENVAGGNIAGEKRDSPSGGGASPRPSRMIELAALVEHTYVDSLDCPELSGVRSAASTLAGYIDAPSFRRDGWFWVRHRGSQRPIGMLVLACHGPAAEIVYVGLLPEFRGRGIGRGLLGESEAVAAGWGCERMLVALDRRNFPAAALYEGHEFRQILVQRQYFWSDQVAEIARSRGPVDRSRAGVGGRPKTESLHRPSPNLREQ
ncbi:MAG: GNAT family N-acetyltransferase [Planctomycetota bacterium]